mmetsp:Transcript_33510/g.65998  ORF Transcript_33510/g.65998 Transcript_33510/m.65998 type:complete len:282 (-) Transcript_33510:205-1050(-)
MDEDESGDISYHELLTSYDDNIDFQSIMKLLGLEKEDMKRMMCLMDSDKSGKLSYDELIDFIAKAGKHDIGAQIIMMQLELNEISGLLKNGLSPPNMSGMVTVDKSLPRPTTREQKVLSLRAAAEANGRGNPVTPTTVSPTDVDGFPPIPTEDVTPMLVSKMPVVVSFEAGSQTPETATLDLQLQRLGQMLANRLQTMQAIAAEAEQEVVRLACSARQFSSLNTSNASAASAGSVGSADNLHKSSDGAGNAVTSMPTWWKTTAAPTTSSRPQQTTAGTSAY